MANRREFIRTGVLGAAGLAIGGKGLSARSYSSIIGSNERINLAVVGIRGQGGTHISSWCPLASDKNLSLKTICDFDEHYSRRMVWNFSERSQKSKRIRKSKFARSHVRCGIGLHGAC